MNSTTIYTIGHSNHSINQFLALLTQHGELRLLGRDGRARLRGNRRGRFRARRRGRGYNVRSIPRQHRR